jgi:anti-sigma factor RsiW
MMSDATSKQNAPDDPVLLLQAYVDGELDPAAALDFERRLAEQPALRAERDRIMMLRQAMKDHLPNEDMPADLPRRIEKAIGLRKTPRRPTWLSLAASVVVTAALASSSTWLMLSSAPDESHEPMVFSNHLRSLMAPQPVDINSSERHTVKPWFNGRVTESPRVIDLANAGYPLVGGRVDVIDLQPAPTLVYHRRQHVISLTAIRTSAVTAAAVSESADRGFNIVKWRHDGVEYWAVSDLNMPELREFARLFQAGS